MHQCKLVLDNYTGQYFPGSSIQGRVLLNFSSQTTLRGLKLRLICREHTEWIGSESYYDQEQKSYKRRDTRFEGDNNIFTNEQMLYGDRSGSTTLGMGQHIYPFILSLPPNIPSTYQSEKGSIFYKLIAIVDRPMALDYEDQMIFVVNSPIDLNTFGSPDLLQPSSYSDDKTVCCWCCAQGPISMDVDLPKKTLVPGETVDIKVRVTNMSNTNVEGVSAELKQRITYRVDSPSTDEKEDTNILVDLNDLGVGAHGENNYSFKVTLPPNIMIPNFSQCRFFTVEYVYKIQARLPSMHSNLEIKMYPEVGHIPIGMNSMVPPPSQPYPPVATPGASMYPPSNMGWNATPSAPPIDPKQQEANQGFPSNGQPYEQPPPSYESLRM